MKKTFKKNMLSLKTVTVAKLDKETSEQLMGGRTGGNSNNTRCGNSCRAH